jgi:hypothetical protein
VSDWAKEHWKQFSAQEVKELLKARPLLAGPWDNAEDELCYERWECGSQRYLADAQVSFNEDTGQWDAWVRGRLQGPLFALCADAKAWVDAELVKEGWLLL